MITIKTNHYKKREKQRKIKPGKIIVDQVVKNGQIKTFYKNKVVVVQDLLSGSLITIFKRRR